MLGWSPDLQVTPVTSTTLALSVGGVPTRRPGIGISVQLFPADDELPATAPIALQATEAPPIPACLRLLGRSARPRFISG